MIKKVTNNINTADIVLKDLERNNEILPVEMQMVGLMLENKIRVVGDISPDYYLKELGGKDGLIQDYLGTHLRRDTIIPQGFQASKAAGRQ